jgi:beta-glucosidase
MLYKLLTAMKDRAEAKGKPDLTILFIYNMPFRAIGKMVGSVVSEKMVDDILLMVNGHFFRGMGRLVVDFFKNQSANKAFIKKLEG